MNRRSFITKGSLFSAAALLCGTGLGSGFNFAQEHLQPQLVEVIGNNWQQMLVAGINELGGMGNFVNARQKVLLKPTMLYSKALHSNSNALLVEQLIKLCQHASVGQVYVLDQTIDDWRVSYKNSGIERVTKNLGCRIIPANHAFYYGPSNFSYHKHFDISDVIINLTKASARPDGFHQTAFHNLSGLVWGTSAKTPTECEEQVWALFKMKRPVLNIIEIDGDNEKTLVISADIFAADAWALKIQGLKPENEAYLQKAAQLQMGNVDTDQLTVSKVFLL